MFIQRGFCVHCYYSDIIVVMVMCLILVLSLPPSPTQIQFFTVLAHCLFVMYQQCGFPDGYIWALIAYLISHIVLFSNFYNQVRNRIERERDRMREIRDKDIGERY